MTGKKYKVVVINDGDDYKEEEKTDDEVIPPPLLAPLRYNPNLTPLTLTLSLNP